MICYAESSAVLAWLYGEPRGREVLRILTGAKRVVSSDLTLFECDRALRRRVAAGELTKAAADTARTTLMAFQPQWEIVPLSPETLKFSRRSFPREPVRSLDAIHLGAALLARTTTPDLRIVTLDERVSANALLLGFPVEPAPAR